MVKGVYHTQDPVENLKIRINLREVSSSHSLSSAVSKKRALFDQIIEFSWQEKVYGPRDVADYVMHKKSSYGRQTQLDSRRNLANLERNGVKVADLLSEVMLYTYCNDEPFYPPQRSIVSESNKTDSHFDSYLSHALEPSASVDEDSRQEKVSERIKREEDVSEYMQICLATGIKKDVSNGAAITSEMSESVLCSIKLMKSGLLVVSPGFSHVIAEDSQIVHYDTEVEEKPSASTNSLFINNNTITAGIKKGFRLSSHRVRTSAGEEFEYSIENVNGVLSPIEIEELMAAELRKDVALSEQSRGTSRKILDPDDPDELNKWNHSSVPDPYNQMTSFYAEIVSASGFAVDDPVYVRYQMLLPKDKSSCMLKTAHDIAQNNRGRRPSSVTGAMESPQNPLHKEKNQVANNALSEMPSAVDGPRDDVSDMAFLGHTQLSSSNVSSQLHVFNGHFGRSNRDRLSMISNPTLFLQSNSSARHTLGFFLLFSTVLAVFFGPSYPFWLAPALTLWLYLLSGPLPSNSQTIVMSSFAASNSVEKGCNDNDFVAQTPQSQNGMCATSNVIGPVAADSSAVFGHQFQCDVYVHNPARGDGSEACRSRKHISPSADQATLFLEVFSVSSYERHTLEGCGYVHLPLMDIASSSSLAIDVDVNTWKPIGDHKSRLVDAFLGGGSHLTNIRFMEVPNKDSSAISKFGTRTESAGIVRFKCNTVMYSPSPALTDGYSDIERPISGNGAEESQSRRRTSRASSQGRERKASSVKRTVEDILNSYKSTELLNRSLSRSGLRSGYNTPKKGVSVWGDSDGGTSQDGSIAMMSVDRIADIVARARANTESLRHESKGGEQFSTFTKPRGVPRPSDGRTPRTARDHERNDVDPGQNAGLHTQRSDLTDEEGWNIHPPSHDINASDDEILRRNKQQGSRYESEENYDEDGGIQREGANLMERFEAAGVTETQAESKKSSDGGVNKGILIGKPLNPVKVRGEKVRSKGLEKVFGSDSEDEEEKVTGKKTHALSPLHPKGQRS